MQGIEMGRVEDLEEEPRAVLLADEHARAGSRVATRAQEPPPAAMSRLGGIDATIALRQPRPLMPLELRTADVFAHRGRDQREGRGGATWR